MATIDTVVIGAGQAGLALSHHLTAGGQEHLLLERGRVGERWYSERWDSFTLLTPNWYTRLPGWRYRGPDPDGFMDRAQVQAFFAGYARSFRAPVRSGTTVTDVRPETGGWTVRTDSGVLRARNVVVATGNLDRPAVPALSSAFPAGLTQLHSSSYRNSGQLPDGGVLVVGAGPTGHQLADELAGPGRAVHLAVGRHRLLPRRYRGRDAFWWMDRTGATGRTVDDLTCRPGKSDSSVLTAGRPIDLRLLVSHGVVPHGRLLGLETGTRAVFADDLAASMHNGEEHARRFRFRVDAYLSRTGLPAAPADDGPAGGVPHWAREPVTALDLRRAGIKCVIWATGYRRDYSWLHAPVLDATGEPVQRRGVTAVPGLYFLGLWFMWRRDSSLIDGVGADAEYLADRIVARTARAAA